MNPCNKRTSRHYITVWSSFSPPLKLMNTSKFFKLIKVFRFGIQSFADVPSTFPSSSLSLFLLLCLCLSLSSYSLCLSHLCVRLESWSQKEKLSPHLDFQNVSSLSWNMKNATSTNLTDSLKQCYLKIAGFALKCLKRYLYCRLRAILPIHLKNSVLVK